MMISRRSIPKVMAATTLVLGGCGGDSAAIDFDVTETIGNEGGTISNSGVIVVIPDGEFSSDTEVRVQTVDASELPLPLPNGLTAASSIIRVSTDPEDDYVELDVTIPYSGEGATILQLIYDEDHWEWDLVDDEYGNWTLADGVATGSFGYTGFFVVVRPANVPEVDVEALCEGFISCEDDQDEDYTQADCEARLPVALIVYASYYGATSPACEAAVIDYYACLSDNWTAEPVCEMDGYYSYFPDFQDCEDALYAACPDLD